MGKRKAKAAPPPKKAKNVLPTNFPCLFCNHENAVNVKMDKKAQTGDLWCKVCGQSFQTTINALSDPVDVYSDWVDACDSVAKEAAKTGRAAAYEDDEPEVHEKLHSQADPIDNDDEELDPDDDFDDDE